MINADEIARRLAAELRWEVRWLERLATQLEALATDTSVRARGHRLCPNGPQVAAAQRAIEVRERVELLRAVLGQDGLDQPSGRVGHSSSPQEAAT